LGLWTLDGWVILVVFLEPPINLWTFLKREVFVAIS
jgi:hypothetical protein